MKIIDRLNIGLFSNKRQQKIIDEYKVQVAELEKINDGLNSIISEQNNSLRTVKEERERLLIVVNGLSGKLRNMNEDAERLRVANVHLDEMYRLRVANAHLDEMNRHGLSEILAEIKEIKRIISVEKRSLRDGFFVKLPESDISALKQLSKQTSKSTEVVAAWIISRYLMKKDGTSLVGLNLPVRVFQNLARAGFRSVEEIEEHIKINGSSSLRQFRNIGEKSISKILEALNEFRSSEQ